MADISIVRSIVEQRDGIGPAGELARLDLRFRALLGTTAWARLPAAVRARFAHRLGENAVVSYTGTIVACRVNAAGWLLSQVCRLIGAPLPLYRVPGMPAAVVVTDDGATGQHWTRLYGRPRGFPQVICSTKRFAGKTGLEEYLGAGFGIALRVRGDDVALHFDSDHYFLALGPVRLRLPRWLAPGDLTVSHVAQDDGGFDFVLTLRHPWLGELMAQRCHFHDQADIASEGRAA
ncbi:MAG: hypothetical protein JWL96_4454 [Sphingomonas bacterium]|uniref:DUF4166 domain-containing protein n=1 Tax=Sphingomonas bacterium TaxID=1895847 RepID=UPI002630277F|nr:DUF4166 domain-containing protein [Sphingomonas bacterium]MDB5712384.1 hypothetical protein [Sphingomonas bacterium]